MRPPLRDDYCRRARLVSERDHPSPSGAAPAGIPQLDGGDEPDGRRERYTAELLEQGRLHL